MHRSGTSWRSFVGVTLIEVLAALALLGSLAVAMLLSRGRLIEQHHRARQKLEAVQAADALLATWWADASHGSDGPIPINQRGRLESHPGWVWETVAIDCPELNTYQAGIIRLRILAPAPGNHSGSHEASKGEASGGGTSGGEGLVQLTAIDLVVPASGSPARVPEGTQGETPGVRSAQSGTARLELPAIRGQR